MQQNVQTPEGTRDRLFGECEERRKIQTALGELFCRRGFGEVCTPEVEFYDLFLRSGNPLPQEQMVKIIDRSGMILVMRPDCTAPIARVHAARLRHIPAPQRLYYDQTVFRSGQQHRGGRSEIAQCGVELLDAQGLRADLEVLALAADALKTCGLERFHIEIGHVGFFRELTAALGLEEGEREIIRDLIENKNFAALADRLAPYHATVPGYALDRLPYLFGGIEVLDEAEGLYAHTSAIAYLRTLYNELSAAGYGSYFRFDLGLVHQIDYYTGLVFRGYAQGAGDAVLSGGRYDRLLAAFGPDTPATGFAVDVDAVAGCLPTVETLPVEGLVHFSSGCLAQALAAIDRGEGKLELSPMDTLEQTRLLAQAKGAEYVLLVEPDGERRVSL